MNPLRYMSMKDIFRAKRLPTSANYTLQQVAKNIAQESPQI